VGVDDDGLVGGGEVGGSVGAGAGEAGAGNLDGTQARVVVELVADGGRQRKVDRADAGIESDGLAGQSLRTKLEMNRTGTYLGRKASKRGLIEVDLDGADAEG